MRLTAATKAARTDTVGELFQQTFSRLCRSAMRKGFAFPGLVFLFQAMPDAARHSLAGNGVETGRKTKGFPHRQAAKPQRYAFANGIRTRRTPILPDAVVTA